MEKFKFLKDFSYYNLDSTLEEVYEYVDKYKNFSFDFETVSLTDMTPLLVSFVVYNYKNNEDSIVIDNNKVNFEKYGFVVDLRTLENYSDKLKSVFDISNLIICHNLYFDYRVLYELGINVNNYVYKTFDTMISLYVTNTERSKKLKDYIENSVSYEDSFDLSNFDLYLFKVYNLQDSYYTYKLYLDTLNELRQKNSFLAFFLEMQTAFFSLSITNNGINIDKEYLSLFENRIKDELNKLEAYLINESKSKFNYDLDLNCRLSILDLFKNHIFQDLSDEDLEEISTDKGNVSISIENIKNLSVKEDLKEFVGKYIEYKELRKLIENYSSSNLFKNMYRGRIVPNIRSSGTKTARMIITSPPLQTIPSSGIGKEIRKAFSSEKKDEFLVVDLSQLELRILTHYLNNQELVDKYNSGEDFHKQTSDNLGIERKQAKIINFMIVYGGGPKSLSKKLGVSEEQAKEFIRIFSEKLKGYPELKSFIESYVQENGYIKLPLNYYRYLDPQDFSSLRIGFNTLIQMTASIYMKIGMYLIYKVFSDYSGLCLQVHDELIFENKNEYLQIIFKFLKLFYENTFVYYLEEDISSNYVLGQDLKFIIEGKIGSNWLECKE
jgi:DNA polymerase-1